MAGHFHNDATLLIQNDCSADLESFKLWINTCRKTHSECKADLSSSHKKRDSDTGMLVIDCRTRTIRAARKHEPYICLSYVWGAHPMNGSTTCGARLLHNVPKTIEDAMFVASKLGIPQLWVDQYCINQHNLAEKTRTINDMDTIYGNAELTIIAASGRNAHSGLSGIRGTSRISQRYIQIGANRHLAFRDSTELIKRSLWMSRGWTFQEGLLSRRRLVFTEAQLYFQCNDEYRLEGLPHRFYSEGSRYEDETRVFPHRGIGFQPHHVYDRLIEYLSRNLSYGSDSLNAFLGILNAFNTELRGGNYPSANHLYGIPMCHKPGYDDDSRVIRQFLSGLSWRFEKPAMTQDESNVGQDSIDVPSWTWAAYKARHSNVACRLVQSHSYGTMMYDSRGVGVSITNKQTNRTGFLSTQLQGAEYTDFFPWFDLDTWVLDGSISQKTSLAGHQQSLFFGREAHLDEPQSADGWKVSALYLGIKDPNPKPCRINFLLVCQDELENDTFRRIGVWCIEVSYWNLRDRATQSILQESLDEIGCTTERFEKRTVRVV